MDLMSGTLFSKLPRDVVKMNFTKKGNCDSAGCTVRGKPGRRNAEEKAGRGAEAETAEVDAKYWLPNESTDDKRLDGGHQLDERNFGTLWQDERLLRPVSLLQRLEHSGRRTDALGKRNGIILKIP